MSAIEKAESEGLLPSSWGAPITETVGVFRLGAGNLASWLAEGLSLRVQPLSTQSLDVCVSELSPLAQVGVSKALVFEHGGWSFLLNNAKLGTDLGMLPSLCAREKEAEALRVTMGEASPSAYAAVILAVYEPTASPPLRCRRVISAANDGGKWVFSQYGEPFPFEDQSRYSLRKVSERFTPSMLRHYVLQLGVPMVGRKTQLQQAFLLCGADNDA